MQLNPHAFLSIIHTSQRIETLEKQKKCCRLVQTPSYRPNPLTLTPPPWSPYQESNANMETSRISPGSALQHMHTLHIMSWATTAAATAKQPCTATTQLAAGQQDHPASGSHTWGLQFVTPHKGSCQLCQAPQHHASHGFHPGHLALPFPHMQQLL